MITPEALPALRDRLIAATEGDGELDREIALALGWTPPAIGLPYWHDAEGNHWTAVPDWSTSMSDAFGLVDRLAPIGPMTSHELNHTLARDGEEFWNFRIKVYDVHDEGAPPRVHHGTAYAACISVLLALVSALSQPGVQS